MIMLLYNPLHNHPDNQVKYYIRKFTGTTFRFYLTYMSDIIKYSQDIPFMNVVYITDDLETYEYLHSQNKFVIYIKENHISNPEDIDTFVNLLENININCENVYLSINRDNQLSDFYSNIVCTLSTINIKKPQRTMLI